MTPEEAEDARRAYREAHAAAADMRTKKLPSPFARFAMNPLGFSGDAVDTQKEYSNDQRRTELLRRLSEYASKNPMYVLEQFGGDLGGEINKYRRGEVDNTPFHNRGMLSVGAPMHTAQQVFGATAAMPLHGGKMLANQITPNMFPGAAKDLAKAANTLTMYKAEDLGLVPRGTGTTVEDAMRAEELRGKVPWDATSEMLDIVGEMASHESQQAMDKAVPMGPQHYLELGLPPAVAIPLGVTHDMVSDPYGAAFDAMRYARGGLLGQAWKALARDAAIGAGPTAGPYAYDRAKAGYDAMIKRLHGIQGEPIGR